MITQEEFIINLLARTAITATQDNDDGTFQVFLPTRNPYIIEFFNGGNLEFQEYHAPTKTYQVYDILTNQLIKLNIDKLALTLYGLPMDIAPPVIANPDFHPYLSNKDLFDLHLPFLEQVKQMRDAGKLRTVVQAGDQLKNSSFLNFLICTFGELNYELLMDNAISIFCNTDLSNYITANFEAMRAYETLDLIYKEKGEDLNIKNLNALNTVLNDKENLKTLWKEFLLKKRDLLIEEHNKEKEQVINDLKNTEGTQEVELLFVEQQYNAVLESLQELNLDKEFEKLEGNGFLYYVPDVIWQGIQNELPETVWFNSTTVKLLQALRENNIVIPSDINREYLVFAVTNNSSYISFDEYLSRTYTDQLREIRFKQVCEHAEKLAESIKTEAVDMDEADLQEIINLVLNFDQFKSEIDEQTTINGILQYWPAVLLPSPSFVKYI